MELELAIALEKEIHDLGYKTFDEFALKNIKREIQEKIDGFQNLIHKYEHKYGMNYDAFCEQFHTLKQWSMFEKEDDGMEWKAYEIVVKNLKNKLQNL